MKVGRDELRSGGEGWSREDVSYGLNVRAMGDERESGRCAWGWSNGGRVGVRKYNRDA